MKKDTTSYSYDYAMGSPFSRIRKHDGYREGYFVFERGVVIIYHGGELTSFSMYVNGRGYYRSIKGKDYTDIGLARLAGKFGRETLKSINSK